MSQKKIICLMGPTAAGKTPLAVELVKHFPLDIISVDSAMIYRGMDIGTAKPDHATLQAAPHRLINICDPVESYSAGRFREDVLREIADIHAAGRIPFLVGGTMMYFRILLQGIASLPQANAELRESLKVRAEQEGVASLHAELAQLDPAAAHKIHANDWQRISRALEVHHLTGRPISSIQQTETSPLAGYDVLQLALMPVNRANLHANIAKRFQQMLEQGFIEEVEALYQRGDLNPSLPSIRSVGYRQVWEYLAGNIDDVTMQEKAIAATRQLAKRQITWLRTWPDCHLLDNESSALPQLTQHLITSFLTIVNHHE